MFVALAGTSYAAANLPARSVGTTQLKNGAVGAKQLKNRSVTQPKLDPALLTQLRGQKGDTGATGLQGSQGQNGSADTPQQVLGKLAQVDGNGSGLDADTIDGVDSPEIAKVVGDLTLENFNFGPIAAGRCGQISTNGLQGSMPGDFILATPTNGDRLQANSP